MAASDDQRSIESATRIAHKRRAVSTAPSFTPAAVPAERLIELRELWRAVDETPSLVAACALAAGTASRILGAPLAILGRAADGWELIARSDVPDAPVALPPTHELGPMLASNGSPTVTFATRGGASVWTRVPLGSDHDPDWLVLLPGAWTSSASIGWLRLFAQDLHRAFRLSAMKDALRRRDASIATAYALSRRLARLSGRAMHQAIVDAVAHALGTEQASLAVYDRRKDALAISAVRGYSPALVEDLRIAPGSGVIGRVFTTRKPIMNTDSQVWPRRRLRYRSPSFLAVPIVAHGAVVAVLSTTEPRDGRPFDRHDLALARWLCASSAGAVASDLLRGECDHWQRAAALDPLTGLANRRHFEARLDEEMERARRYALDLALLAIDVDHFKNVNDTYGHAAGDALLRTLALIMHRSVRAFDVCARIGGDEFAMLLPATSGSNALHSAERLCERVAAYREDGEWSALGVTLSVGVTTLAAGDSAAELLARADRALYDAKARGRNGAAHAVAEPANLAV
jgi:diguanylate cyclase (GGDEF)-like protein